MAPETAQCFAIVSGRGISEKSGAVVEGRDGLSYGGSEALGYTPKIF